MNLLKEEELMYQVMNAINNCGIPVSFKGSMVLKMCLIEHGYKNDVRHTVDIDANWNSDFMPTSEQIRKSLQTALDNANIDLAVSCYREYGEKRSAGFELKDKNTDTVLFTMDIDVNRPLPDTKMYEIDGIVFKGVTANQIIADKITVVSIDKVYRRIKDVVDLYYLSKVVEYEYEDVVEIVERSGKTIGDFNAFLNNKETIKHSYDKFRFAGDVIKPDFDEMYSSVRTYIDCFYIY